jgi:SEC-C motif-containing protein
VAGVKADAACRCGGSSHAACCGRFIEAGALPETAEQLMRSRYSAYALGHAAYLLATWHPSTRPATLDLGRDTKWIGLQVLRHTPDPATPDRAVVEFVARCRIGGRAHRLHEASRFVRQEGRWYYVDGAQG